MIKKQFDEDEYLSVLEFRKFIDCKMSDSYTYLGLDSGLQKAISDAPKADVVSREQYDGICLAYQRCIDRIRQIVGDNVKLCHKLKEFGAEDPYLGNSGYEINDFLNKDEKFVKYVEQNFTDTSANDFMLDKIEELYTIIHKYKMEMEYKDKLISELSNKVNENESK